MFDVDQDGILNLIEAQHALRCVGFNADADQVKVFTNRCRVQNRRANSNCSFFKVKAYIYQVSIDKTHFSLSFNEYLTLVSRQRISEPSETALLDVFM